MALVDKMKAQAAQLAQKAQEAGKAGQTKLEEVQAKRRADGLLRDLGRAVYSLHGGVENAETEARIESLVGELKAYEAQYGPIDASGDEE
jgi:hypothetical protein